MATHRIAVVGIDGAGKSAVVRALVQGLGAHGQRVSTFRALQVHLEPDLPLGGLSQSLHLLSGLGDELKQPSLKAIALFLSMTLYGPVERFLLESRAPRWLVTERHPLVDSVTYAKFYLPQLQGPLDPGLEGLVLDRLARQEVGAEVAWDRLQAWIRGLPGFEGASASFWNLPEAVRAVFKLPPGELLLKLRGIYRTELPEDLVLVTTALSTLGADDGGERGLHATGEALAMLQDAYYHTCSFLQASSPRMGFYPFNAKTGRHEKLVQSLQREPVAVR